MNAREAARRQQTITDTLHGLKLLATTNLLQELDPEQEDFFKLLLETLVLKMDVQI